MGRTRGRRRKTRRQRRSRLWILVLGGLAGVTTWLALPDFTWLNQPDTGLVITVKGKNGQVRPFPVGIQNPMWVRLGDISPAVTAEVVAAVDSGFFSHWGLDSARLVSFLLSGRSATGPLPGTISMHLVSTLYLRGRDQGVWRMAQLFMAFKLDRTLSKRRILELYLNTAPWGEGVYGIGEASRRYFGNDPRFLSRAQSARLAARLTAGD